MADGGLVSGGPSPLARMQSLDLWLCRWLNGFGQQGGLTLPLFRLVSRLGDGVFWYALLLVLPLVHGWSGWRVGLQMALTALVCLAVYRRLKAGTGRPRPCDVHPWIVKRGTTLDTFSFPSGHTLQATAFSIVLVAHLPVWAWLVIPFSLLVAWSRPVLGLHYPSDVLAGALLGIVIATLSLVLWPAGPTVPMSP